MRLGRIAAAFIAAVLALSSLGLAAAAGPESSAPEQAGSAPAPQVVLIHDDRYVGARRVPRPAQAVRGVQLATFSVNWNPPATCDPDVASWPSNAQTAFLYATSIWGSLIHSSVPIEIDACWRTDFPSYILGSGGATYIYHDELSFPYPNTWYVVALANALEESDLNGGTAEIRVNFNANKPNWYHGTDGNTPWDQVDFVSVVLHELCHGLGFHGYMYVDILGLGHNVWTLGYPAAFDHFTEDGSGVSLLSGYTEKSTDLAAALQGQRGGVYFDAPNANAGNGGARVRLYAPNPWVDGSSYTHLDQIFNGTPNALMTFSLSNGESQHDPGPIALGMLEDIGWVLGGPDMTMLKQVVGGGADVEPGDAVTMTLSIGNSGTVTATSVVVTDTLSSDILSPTFSASLPITATGVVSYVWSLPDLGPGASAVITIYGTISPTLPAGFAIVNRASISTDLGEDNTDNNSSAAIIGGQRGFLPIVLRSYP